MNESHVPSAALSVHDASDPGGEPAGPATVPPRPEAPARPSGWTGRRITALVIGALLALVSLGLLSSGGTALWEDLSYRDSAGYVTTGAHAFSTSGSALATEPIELGSPGVGWLYSTVLLGDVRIRVTPASSGSTLFVGIAPTAEADRYLAGVNRTEISDFWGDKVQVIGGGTPASAPGMQDFWVASASGPGAQTLTWSPANGSWTVVVMNAGGRPGVDVTTDLGATMPTLLAISIAALVAGGALLVGGVLLIVGAIRRVRRKGTA